MYILRNEFDFWKESLTKLRITIISNRNKRYLSLNDKIQG